MPIINFVNYVFYSRFILNLCIVVVYRNEKIQRLGYYVFVNCDLIVNKWVCYVIVEFGTYDI